MNPMFPGGLSFPKRGRKYYYCSGNILESSDIPRVVRTDPDPSDGPPSWHPTVSEDERDEPPDKMMGRHGRASRISVHGKE